MDLGDAWCTRSPGRPGTSGRRSFASEGPARASDGAPRMSENNGPVPPGDNPYRAPDQEPFAPYRAPHQEPFAPYRAPQQPYRQPANPQYAAQPGPQLPYPGPAYPSPGQPYPPQPYGQPYGFAQPAPHNGMAIGALVVSIVADHADERDHGEQDGDDRDDQGTDSHAVVGCGLGEPIGLAVGLRGVRLPGARVGGAGIGQLRTGLGGVLRVGRLPIGLLRCPVRGERLLVGRPVPGERLLIGRAVRVVAGRHGTVVLAHG